MTMKRYHRNRHLESTLDVHRLSTDEAVQFHNSSAGLRDLRRWIGVQMPDLVIYEATGAYHAALERSFAGGLAAREGKPATGATLRTGARHKGQDRCR